jgi:hypothetical protein
MAKPAIAKLPLRATVWIHARRVAGRKARS